MADSLSDFQTKLNEEISQSSDVKVRTLMQTLGVNQGELANLLGVSSGILASIVRKGTATAAMDVILNVTLRDTARDRYIIDGAKKRILDLLKSR